MPMLNGFRPCLPTRAMKAPTGERWVLKDKTGIRYVEHLDGDGPTIFEHACKLGLEGIVSKRVDLPYESGPSKHWQKVKNKTHPAVQRVREAFERERARRR